MDEQEVVEQWIELLELAGAAQAEGELLDLRELALTHKVSDRAIREQIQRIEDAGLLLSGIDEGQSPILLSAGRQYLNCRGDVPRDVLRFLPRVVDDLNARQALMTAGTVLVDEYRGHVLRGRGVEYAEGLVPPAFQPGVTERLALDLFAAAVALLTRLSEGRPAGCVAEEILAVALIGQAEAHLDMRTELGELTADEADAAAEAAKGGLFELFEDDDVLDLFEMEEPSDAAVAGHSRIRREMGVVDQRIESWFESFGWTIPTGYIGQ